MRPHPAARDKPSPCALKCMQVAPSCLALIACASTSSRPRQTKPLRLQMYASCPILSGPDCLCVHLQQPETNQSPCALKCMRVAPSCLALIACAGSKSRSPCDVLVLHQKSFSRAPRHSKGRRTPWQSIPPERKHRTRLERGAHGRQRKRRGASPAQTLHPKEAILRENKVHTKSGEPGGVEAVEA